MAAGRRRRTGGAASRGPRGGGGRSRPPHRARGVAPGRTYGAVGARPRPLGPRPPDPGGRGRGRPPRAERRGRGRAATWRRCGAGGTTSWASCAAGWRCARPQRRASTLPRSCRRAAPVRSTPPWRSTAPGPWWSPGPPRSAGPWPRAAGTTWCGAAIRPRDGSFGSARAFSRLSRQAMGPRVAARADGRAVVAWTGYEGGDNVVEVARRLPGTDLWWPPTSVPRAGPGAREPRVGLGSGGGGRVARARRAALPRPGRSAAPLGSVRPRPDALGRGGGGARAGGQRARRGGGGLAALGRQALARRGRRGHALALASDALRRCRRPARRRWRPRSG